MSEQHLTSMESRRKLARRIDALLIHTSRPGSRPSEDLTVARAPAVRRIRDTLVDESIAVPARTLARVTAFLAHPDLEVAARVAGELGTLRPLE